jgi:Transcription factor WhiB
MVLRLRVDAPSWLDAKCLGEPPKPGDDAFFDNSEDGYEDLTDEGVQFCNGTADGKVCPMRNECLLFALVNNERFGVFGGMLEQDRRLLRKIYPWQGGTEPHPEWRFYTSAEIAEMYAALPPKERARLDSDTDE